MSWYRNYTACLKVTNPPPALIADVGRAWGSHPGVPDGRPNWADEVLGTPSLAAADAAGARRFLAQSIAWAPPGSGEAVAEHERQVLEASGVVVRYGQLYGPGTYYPDDPPPPPRIHVDAAARRTMGLLGAPSGIVVLTDEDDGVSNLAQ